jgi:signal transduction histidine kinase
LLVLAVFLGFGGTTVFFWHHQNRDERELVFRHTKTFAEQIVVRMEGLMKARMTALRLLADRWVERTPPDFSRERFVQFAQDIYRHYPGFAAINWIDPQGVIQWVFPEENNLQTKMRNIRRDPFYKEVFNESGKYPPLAVTPCAPANGQGFAFEAFIPLFYQGALQGYIEGAFQVNRIAEICLAEDVFRDFSVRLYEGRKLIYASGEQKSLSPPVEDRLYVAREIQFPGKTWRLDLEPSPLIFSSEAVPNVSFLIFGLAASAILSLLLLFLLQRMNMYKEARDQAFHEIEERKQAQKALQVNEKELERLLLELARNNEELETFVYIVSHDLKTPIVTIEGFIGALQEDFGDLISKDGEKYLSYMSDAARKMEMLINDLLELSRVGRLREEKEEFPFGEAVQEALSVLQTVIRERGVQVDIQKDLPVVCGDRKRLVQVMENLLSNAVKYMGEDNPSPRIQVGIKREGGQDLFFVRDNGIGIDRRYFEKIFQVFQRLPSAKERREGTGVGLAIVKQIVERAGGRIWVESEAGRGSTFFFTLKDKEV